MGMIRDLLSPENHRDPYVWAAVLLAHAAIGSTVWCALALVGLAPWATVAIVSLIYLAAWEGRQLSVALRRGDRLIPAAADGVVDWVGVTFGIYACASLWAQDSAAALAAWMALMLVAATGYRRRA